jgi:hypothetical protein
MKTVKVLLVSLAVLLAAQRGSAATGFYLSMGMGAAFPQMSGDIKDVHPKTGLALELIELGYNFTPQLGLGFILGGSSGPADDLLGDDTMWTQAYMVVNFRFSLDTGNPIVPYFDVGVGDYSLMFDGDDGTFASDAAVGLRVAVGTDFYLGNFYIAPELSYHFVQYRHGDFDLERNVFLGYPRHFRSEFDSRGDMLQLQVKLGYHFRRD